MEKKLRVGVLFGGKSKEHEVSIWSAKNIVESLDATKYDVLPLALTKANRLVTAGGNALEQIRIGGQKVITQQCVLLKEEQDSINLGVLADLGLDVVLPVMHGDFGEDGRLQGFLDLLGIPYAGSGVLASAISMDKVVQKQLCVGMDVPMVRWTFCLRDEWEGQSDTVLARVLAVCGYPCFVKPANTGSSVGISKVDSPEDLDAAMETAFLYDDKVIIEQGLDRPREIEVALLAGPDGLRAAVSMAEVHPSAGFYDFDAKYQPNSTTTAKIPAVLSPDQHRIFQELALRVASLHTIYGLCRVDFFLDHDGKIYWNELNALPGFTENSAFGKMWAQDGLSQQEVLEWLIQSALERSAHQNILHHEA
ncbi:D-alanine--D-alanine ligase A [Candidatus Gracilibacteria bacterium CG17_big_fil_post_rev_8_21_14_2_50_48_13]|nr:MAG: D-alanine--D-alanine ligase A [Candidatus Gracilibacteria bacterium CG17_big_fil_post_rev_8_21_14_2_50_48_13]